MQSTLAVVGPTATGKSALALELSEALRGEIINADALQVYRGLDIGTAKPSVAERRRVPHHLVDILDPDEAYSAGEFARRARGLVVEIRERDAVPIVVGGSGLYLRALIEGISPLPPPDPELRLRLRSRLAREGLDPLRAELAGLDPDTERRLAPRDTQRVLRALEVALSTGRPLSRWVAARPFGEGPLETLQIGLTLPRPILYDRIEERVRRMVEAGWVEEVSGLLDRFDPEAPAFQAIGYRQIVRFLKGEWALEQAVGDTIRATRRFAKRQLTWFRKQREIHWIAADDPGRCRADVLELLDHPPPKEAR